MCGSLIFKTPAAEIFFEVSHFRDCHPVKVVAETVMDTVIVAKTTFILWHLFAYPRLTVSVIVITAVVYGLSFLKNDLCIRSFILDIFIIIEPLAISPIVA